MKPRNALRVKSYEVLKIACVLKLPILVNPTKNADFTAVQGTKKCLTAAEDLR